MTPSALDQTISHHLPAGVTLLPFLFDFASLPSLLSRPQLPGDLPGGRYTGWERPHSLVGWLPAVLTTEAAAQELKLLVPGQTEQLR